MVGSVDDRIVITGGAGFVGSHLVRWIMENSRAKVVVVDNLFRGSAEAIAGHLASGRVELIEHDIRDLAGIREIFRGSALIFHLAAQSNVIGAAQGIEYSFAANVVGTFNVLLAAHEGDAKRVIFTSSREVYGEPPELPVREDQPLRAKNAYGASKAAGEQYCNVFRDNYGLDVRVLRLANVYGPGDRDRVIPLFCERANQGSPLIVYGGSQVLDLVWVGDVARALWETAQADDWAGPVNVGSGVGVTVLDLAHKVNALLNRPDSYVQVEQARQIEVSRFIADTSRMRKQLGWAPGGHPLSHLAETVEHYCGKVISVSTAQQKATAVG